MKKLNPVIPILLVICLFGFLSSGCQTTSKNPTVVCTTNDVGVVTCVTNWVTVFDPVKTKQVKDAIAPVIAQGIVLVIRNNPKNATNIAAYFRGVGDVFLKMKTTGNFDPTFLLDETNKATQNLQGKVDPYVIAIKNTVLALYSIWYDGRFNAELSPEKWPAAVADVISAAFNTGLIDSGQPGLSL